MSAYPETRAVCPRCIGVHPGVARCTECLGSGLVLTPAEWDARRADLDPDDDIYRRCQDQAREAATWDDGDQAAYDALVAAREG